MIEIARDFSRTPAGRYFSDGPASGERFREEFLIPVLKTSEHVEIKLDGAAGYPSSFLEEAFGGLIRKGILEPGDAHRRIRLVAMSGDYKRYIAAIWSFVDSAIPEKPIQK